MNPMLLPFEFSLCYAAPYFSAPTDVSVGSFLRGSDARKMVKESGEPAAQRC